MSALSESQRKIIEEKRLAALQKLNQKNSNLKTSPTSSSINVGKPCPSKFADRKWSTIPTPGQSDSKQQQQPSLVPGSPQWRSEQNRIRALQKLQAKKDSPKVPLVNNSSGSSFAKANATDNKASFYTKTSSVQKEKNCALVSNGKTSFSPSTRTHIFNNHNEQNSDTLQLKRAEENKAKALEKLKDRSKSLFNDASGNDSDKKSTSIKTGSSGSTAHTGKSSASLNKKYDLTARKNLVANINSQSSLALIYPTWSKSTQKVDKVVETPAPVNPKEKANQNQGKVTLALVDAKRFSAKMEAYNVDIIGIFKTIPSKNYNTVTKEWSFLLCDYQQLTDGLRRLSIKVDGIPPIVLNALRDTNSKPESKPDDTDLSNVEDCIVKTLMPFQKEGVRFGIQHNGRVLIADDMGLGKSIQALAIAQHYKKEWPLLIICPSSMRMAWKQQILKWSKLIPEDDINVVLTGKDDPVSGYVNIISYDLVVKFERIMLHNEFKVVIADESHFMKSSKAARTKACLPLLQKARRAILLSGTPALSRPEELFTQIKAVDYKLVPGGFHKFGLRYCNATQNRFGFDYSGSSNLQELKLLLESKIMIRRLKTEVLQELPDKQRQLVILDPSMVKVSKDLKSQAQAFVSASKREQRSALLSYYSTTAEAKSKGVCEYISDMLESGRKFIVFAHHLVMLDAVTALLQKKKKSFVRIDGSTHPKVRQSIVDVFQNDPDCLVAVLSLTAAGTGLNLTATSTVIFAELYWNPGILNQAEDRAYRIGQKNSVSIVYLFAQKTADDYVWPLVKDKLEVLASAGIGQDTDMEGEVSTFKNPKQKQVTELFEALIKEEEFSSDFLNSIERSESTLDASKTIISSRTPTSSETRTRSGLRKSTTPTGPPQSSIKDFFNTSNDSVDDVNDDVNDDKDTDFQLDDVIDDNDFLDDIDVDDLNPPKKKFKS